MKPDNTQLRISGILFFVLASFIVYFFFGMNRLSAHNSLYEEEVGGYLSAIADAAVLGGPQGMIGHLIRGEYTEANRHPLYVYLLSAFYAPDFDFFVFAKIATLIFGFVFLLTLCFILPRAFGVTPLLFTLGFLAINRAFLHQTTLIASESLLFIFFFLAWCFLTKGYEQPRAFLFGGVALAFAYLTKGTALFLIFAFLPACFFVYRRRIFSALLRRKEVWISLGLFLLLVLPYGIRNVRVYDDPFYNVNNDYLWLDSFGEHYWEGDHSFQAYLSRVGWGGMGERLLDGMRREAASASTLFRWELGPEKTPMLAYALFGVVMALAAVGMWRDTNRLRSITTLFLILGFFVFFSWWAHYTVKLRFLLPLLPILLLYGGMGFQILIVRLSHARLFREQHRLSIIAALLPFIASIFLLIPLGKALERDDNDDRRLSRQVSGTYSVPDGYRELVQWQNETLKDGDRVFVGHDPSFQTRWMTPKRVEFQRVLLMDGSRKFLEYLDKEKPDYLIFHTRPWRDVEKQLTPFVGWDTNMKEFTFREPLPHYEHIEFPGTELRLYLVYRRIASE